MITKFKLYEHYKELDPFGEEEWDDDIPLFKAKYIGKFVARKGDIVNVMKECPTGYAGYPHGQRYIVEFEKDGKKYVCGEAHLERID